MSGGIQLCIMATGTDAEDVAVYEELYTRGEQYLQSWAGGMGIVVVGEEQDTLMAVLGSTANRQHKSMISL